LDEQAIERGLAILGREPKNLLRAVKVYADELSKGRLDEADAVRYEASATLYLAEVEKQKGLPVEVQGQAWYLWGVLSELRNETERAAKFYCSALEFKPSNTECANRLSKIRMTKAEMLNEVVLKKVDQVLAGAEKKQ
jgi:hypothetical protein